MSIGALFTCQFSTAGVSQALSTARVVMCLQHPVYAVSQRLWCFACKGALLLEAAQQDSSVTSMVYTGHCCASVCDLSLPKHRGCACTVIVHIHVFQ